ncbi:N-6 DNA methylase [Hymenobacter sp. RP-2-7]|uniref:site-specific DNA-methyltransferase (adenine-specific) n=1 Tax=Hymenobacter polaris TaxID=2682546 RepID=A0A7Y0AEJ7_9BACT|nr:N-6 DNA methylase [Hymenobacter polaris]NML65905.1 N-6 DNA methylase [Hymenobacter polaris]
MNLIDQAKRDGLISFSADGKYLYYTNHGNKRRNFDNPEEATQLDAYLQLRYHYGYGEQQIALFEPVQMGASTREADIVVFVDAGRAKPYLVVECKKPDTSGKEFVLAVDQAFSYAVASGARFAWITSGTTNEYYEVLSDAPRERSKNRLPNIPRAGENEPPVFKYAYKGLLSTDEAPTDAEPVQPYFELQKLSESELTRRFKLAHNTLWGGGELNPSDAFDELDKLIFCKIWDEKEPRRPNQPYAFQVYRNEDPEELLKRVKGIYEKGRKKAPEVFKADITLTAAKLRTVVGYLEGANLSASDLDSKGRAFETFLDSYFRGDFGQYFTPRAIVEFIVECLPFTHESLVLDTSCGSGGFLLYALDKVRKQADDFYHKERQAAEHYRHWHDFAEKNLYGIEISEQIARAAKMNMIIHDDGHTNVIAADGLLTDEELQRKSGNSGFRYGRFDFILTNPPFGSIVKQTEQAYLKNYQLGFKESDWKAAVTQPQAPRLTQSTEVLFMEQCHKFLQPGGVLAIVIPDGILTNSSLQYVRDELALRYRILVVVSLPQTAFTANGAGVKSSVLFLQKHPDEATEAQRQRQRELEQRLLREQNYHAQLAALDDAQRFAQRDWGAFLNAYPDLTPADLGLSVAAVRAVALPPAQRRLLEQTAEYRTWKKQLADGYTEQRQRLAEQLDEARQQALRHELLDYDIFMALAEDIGYDATGKPTGRNDLKELAPEINRFIDHHIHGTGSALFR